jgi:hypothetical protein
MRGGEIAGQASGWKETLLTHDLAASCQSCYHTGTAFAFQQRISREISVAFRSAKAVFGRYFRGAKDDYTTVISRAIPRFGLSWHVLVPRNDVP